MSFSTGDFFSSGFAAGASSLSSAPVITGDSGAGPSASAAGFSEASASFFAFSAASSAAFFSSASLFSSSAFLASSAFLSSAAFRASSASFNLRLNSASCSCSRGYFSFTKPGEILSSSATAPSRAAVSFCARYAATSPARMSARVCLFSSEVAARAASSHLRPWTALPTFRKRPPMSQASRVSGLRSDFLTPSR